MSPLIVRFIRYAVAFLAAVALTAASPDTSTRGGTLTTSRYNYEGGVSDGRQHGFGVCRYRNGDVYAGYWNNGYKEGRGRLMYADGTVEFGTWRRGIFQKPAGRKFRPGALCYGIDVAKYQKRIAWQDLALKARADGTIPIAGKGAKYLQPVLFAFIKSTEGTTVKDPYFDYNFEQARRVGVIRGAYHFLSINSPVDEQVKFFIENTPLAPGDLPPVLDLEISKATMRRHHAKVCSMALQWLKAVEAHYGVKPIVYTYENYYKKYLKGHGFDGYDFWIARYGAEPSARRWEIWQLTDKGVCLGINHRVDVDRFRGSYAELRKYVDRKGIPSKQAE